MKFIFEVRLKPGCTAEKYAASWARASEIIQRAPGARGTQLQRKIGDPTALLAIASWDSRRHETRVSYFFSQMHRCERSWTNIWISPSSG